jgi:hypothetical protein
MPTEEALALIRTHAFRDDDVDQLTSPESFLGSLRPFVGLREANFHEVMSALRVLAPELGGDNVNRALMSDLWNMCWQAQLIGLDVTGALQRNSVLSEDETGKLAYWLFQICFTISLLLEGEDVSTAFADYDGRYGHRATSG